MPVQKEHQADHARDDEGFGDERQEGRYGHILEHGHVAHHAHDEVAGARAGMERKREILDVAIKLGADFGECTIADQGKADGLPIRCDRTHGGESNHGHGRKGED